MSYNAYQAELLEHIHKALQLILVELKTINTRLSGTGEDVPK